MDSPPRIRERSRSRSPTPPQIRDQVADSPSRRLSLQQPDSPRLRVIITLVASSTVANNLLARLAHRSRLTVLTFPLATSITLLYIIKVARKRQTENRTKRSLIQNVKKVLNGGEAGERVWATGATFVAALALKLWSLRWSDSRESQAVEVFVVPLLVLLYPSIAKPRASPNPQTSRHVELIVTGVAFFVGLALVGTSSSRFGLALSLVQIPIEATSLALLHTGAIDQDEERRSDWMTGSAIASVIVSLLLPPISLFLPNATFAPVFSPVTYLLSLATVLIYSSFIVSLLVTFQASETPCLPSLHVVPSNALNLALTTLARSPSNLRGSRLQLLTVHLGGTAALSQLLRKGDNSDSEPAYETKESNRRSASIFVYLGFIPLLVFAIQSFLFPSSTIFSTACAQLPTSFRPFSCPPTTPELPSSTVDLVISYYDEDLSNTRSDLNYLRRVTFVAERDSKIIVYNKGPREEAVIRKALGLNDWDEVIGLENVGREGATYLKHIVLNYNDTLASLSPDSRNHLSKHTKSLSQYRRGFADHTFFLQPHIAWTIIAKPRMWLIPSDVGFASFGPLHQNNCGEDSGHGSYPLITTVYNKFRGRICPPEGLIIAWAGQFIVSRQRIMANPYIAYRELDDWIEAPKGHWLHDQWGPSGSGGPSNPTFGHTLERSWPTIFDCSDPNKLDKKCFGETIGFGVMKKCICRDV